MPLTVTRQRDETIYIGDPTFIHVPLSPRDRQALEQCADSSLLELAKRLLAAEAGPLKTKVIDIRGEKVRLQTFAPNDVPIHREEVYRAVEQEKRRDTYVERKK